MKSGQGYRVIALWASISFIASPGMNAIAIAAALSYHCMGDTCIMLLGAFYESAQFINCAAQYLEIHNLRNNL